MEVLVPVSGTDFNFDSLCSSPYTTAPSSPKRFGDFSHFSAPTSPSRAASIYNDLSTFFRHDSGRKTGGPTPETPTPDDDEENDFAFDFSGDISHLTAAEELFERGRIRALKPPVRLPKTEIRVKDTDQDLKGVSEYGPGRGRRNGLRERGPAANGSNPSASRRSARSVSPLRTSHFGLEEPVQTEKSGSKTGPSLASYLKTSGKKWRLKDFLLFRSASEGRATTGKDPLRKYSALPKRTTKSAAAAAAAAAADEEIKDSSFRSTDSSGSVRKGRVSAHEMHYTVNRAVSEEMRKKTFLPYRQGLLGCLGFNPTAHGLAKGFDWMTRV